MWEFSKKKKKLRIRSLTWLDLINSYNFNNFNIKKNTMMIDKETDKIKDFIV